MLSVQTTVFYGAGANCMPKRANSSGKSGFKQKLKFNAMETNICYGRRRFRFTLDADEIFVPDEIDVLVFH